MFLNVEILKFVSVLFINLLKIQAQSEKQNVPSMTAINQDQDHNSDNNVQFHPIQKNRRSTIALIRNTLTKSNKVTFNRKKNPDT